MVAKYCLMILAFILLGCGATEIQTVERYVNAKHQFAVQFPMTATQTNQEVPTDAGNLVIQTFSSQAQAIDYAVTVIEYPLVAVQEKGAQTVLEDSVQGSIDSVRGELLERTDISVNDYRGIQQTVETIDKIFVSANFLVENKLYILIVTGDKDVFPYENAQTFLDSFEFLMAEE